MVVSPAPVLFSWQFTLTAGQSRPLAPVWAASTVVAQWDAVSLNGGICVATTGGTTGTAAPTSLGTSVVDGSVTWKFYALALAQGLQVTNTGASNVATTGDFQVCLTPVPPNYGSVAPLPLLPQTVYVASTAGTTIVVSVTA